MTWVDAVDVAAEILGYCKEGRNPAGGSCTRHMSVGWPCEKADASTEVVRSALEQAWDEGLDAGRDRWMDVREFGDPPSNPYKTEPP